MFLLKQVDNSQWGDFLLYFTLPLTIIAALAAVLQPAIDNTGLRFFLSIIFQLSLLASIFGILVKFSLMWLRDLGYIDRELPYIAGFIILFFVLLALFLYTFFQMEQDIKVYDSALFWREVLKDRELLSQSVYEYLSAFYYANGGEYGILPAFPLVLLSYVFGTSFAGYTISILLIYYLPACFFLTLFSLRLVFPEGLQARRLLSFAACFCVFALNVAFFFPLLLGFVDIAGVLIIALLLNLTLTWDAARFDIKMNIALALLTVALLFTRIWFATYVLGFYVAFAIYALIMIAKEETLNGSKVGSLLMNYLFIIVINAICFLLLTSDSSLSAVFSTLHNNIDFKNFWRVQFVDISGIFMLLAAVIGLCMLLYKEQTRLLTVRIFMTMLVSVLLVLFFQDMYWPRLYLIYPTLLIFVGALLTYVIQYSVHNENIQPVGAALILVIVCGNFVFAYVPAFLPFMYSSQPYTVNFRHEPAENIYVPAIKEINLALSEKTQGDNKKVFVVGDTNILSAELVKRSGLPDAVDGAPYIFASTGSEIFPSLFFTADYVLLTDPLAKADNAKGQEIYQQIHDMLLSDINVQQYYALEEEVPFPKGSAVGSYKLFRKIKPVDESIVKDLSDRLKAYYPDAPQTYEPNMFVALFRIDNQTKYDYETWSNNILFAKKADQPIEFTLVSTQPYTRLSFQLTNWEEGMVMTLHNQNGLITSVPINRGDKELYEFAIGGSDFVKITILQSDVEKQEDTDIRITPHTESLS